MNYMRCARCAIGIVCICSAFTNVLANSFIPKSGDQVLETLPSRNDPIQQELLQLRNALAANPNDLRMAVALAQRYVEIWRDGGDPRYLSYAQAALGPWWKMPNPPLAARVMRATLLQSLHHFSEALTDLSAVVKNDPDNAQAWLTRATILQVLGDYPQAISSCTKLSRLVPPLITQTCLSSASSLNGDAENSYQKLRKMLRNSPEASVDIRLWVLTLLAEIAQRRGDQEGARANFEQAMALGIPDTYLLAGYSDFLLEQHNPKKVVMLLKEKTKVDVLLLRYALALKALNSAEAPRYSAMLGQRFEAARMRGDTVHLRELARYKLELDNDPKTALRVALQNWQIQKEPADTRVLLQAALAAHDPVAVKQVLEWLKNNGQEDRSLVQLVAALKTAR
jgi:tetratricopeptide (TPR) repeat protein